MPALKPYFIIFGFGMIFGFFISPFAVGSPKDILLSPSQNLFAQEVESILPKTPPEKSQTTKINIDQLFAYFEQEQQILKNHEPQVLGTVDEINDQSSQIEPLSLKTGKLTIALFGDSMIDTMETNAPYLQQTLSKLYPNMQFDLLNYGIGAQTVAKGLERINQDFNYKDRQYPSILSSEADVFIIDSFAYNPMENLDEYASSLTQLIATFKATGKNVFLLATIAPLKSDFGKGPGGVNWDSDIAWTHATKINAHLEKAISIAQNQNIPIIDCYHATLLSSGEGLRAYVNKHDGIHPSIAGHQFIASQITKVLSF